MAPRLQLHNVFKAITDNVYFQPPENFFIAYPCIVYSRDGSSSAYADNELYRHMKRYQVTVIDRDPETELVDEVETLPFTRFERFFATDDLNHYIFTIFF